MLRYAILYVKEHPLYATSDSGGYALPAELPDSARKFGNYYNIHVHTYQHHLHPSGRALARRASG